MLRVGLLLVCPAPQGFKAPLSRWSEQEQHGWDIDLLAQSSQQKYQHQPGVGRRARFLNRRDLQCFLPKWGWSHVEPGGAEPLGLDLPCLDHRGNIQGSPGSEAVKVAALHFPISVNSC